MKDVVYKTLYKAVKWNFENIKDQYNDGPRLRPVMWHFRQMSNELIYLLGLKEQCGQKNVENVLF